jgi:GAF domain/ANTAR domain
VPDEGRTQPGALVRRICQACVRSLPVTGAAASVMTTGGHRGVVAATDDTARSLEDVQFTLGVGPGCDAFATGRAVLVPELGAPGSPEAGKWPPFRDAAARLGVRAVFSFPLHLGAASLGALTLYHVESGALSGPHLARAVRLSDAAAVAMLDMIAGLGPDTVEHFAGEEVADAGFYRAEIYQAAGMLMVQLGVSIEVATVRLRTHAFTTGRPIGEVARDVVVRRLRLGADNDGSETE